MDRYVSLLHEVLDELPQGHLVEGLLEIGRTCREHLDDPDAAMEAYGRVLDLHPGHEEALDVCEGVCRERGDWPALVDVLEGRLDNTQDPLKRLALQAQLAEAWRGPLQEPARALQRPRRRTKVLSKEQKQLKRLRLLSTLSLLLGSQKL